MAHFDAGNADAAVSASLETFRRLAALRRAAGATTPPRSLLRHRHRLRRGLEGNIGSAVKMTTPDRRHGESCRPPGVAHAAVAETTRAVGPRRGGDRRNLAGGGQGKHVLKARDEAT